MRVQVPPPAPTITKVVFYITREEYNANPNICLECGKPILCDEKHKASQIKIKKFCCQSCSTTYNNRKRKKQDIYKCTKCGNVIGIGVKYKRRLYCDNCNPNNLDWSKITLGSVKEKRKYQLHSRIRGLAQKIYNASSKPKHCVNCGYKKHYEVAHIKAISTFDYNTPISVINDIENLMALCPNCHWEYDNGILTLANICGCSSTG